MVMCWPNGPTSAILRTYSGQSGGVRPREDTNTLKNEAESRTWSPGIFVCRYRMKVVGDASRFIWASGDIAPENGNMPGVHNQRGVFTSDLFSLVVREAVDDGISRMNTNFTNAGGGRSGDGGAMGNDIGFIPKDEGDGEKEKSDAERVELVGAVLCALIAILFT
jgi:hypothetical protein